MSARTAIALDPHNFPGEERLRRFRCDGQDLDMPRGDIERTFQRVQVMGERRQSRPEQTFGSMMPSGRPATIAARSAGACGVSSGLIRTQSCWPERGQSCGQKITKRHPRVRLVGLGHGVLKIEDRASARSGLRLFPSSEDCLRRLNRNDRSVATNSRLPQRPNRFCSQSCRTLVRLTRNQKVSSRR